MKNKNKPANATNRTIIYSVIGFLLLAGLVVGTTNISDRIMQVGNTFVNSTGLWATDGTSGIVDKPYQHPYDVVVCRSNSGYDTSGCNEIITEGDATNRLNSIVNHNGTFYFKSGVYNVSGQISLASNSHLVGEPGTIFYTDGKNNFSSGETAAILTMWNKTNIEIDHLTFNASNNAAAIMSYGHNNLNIHDNIFTGNSSLSDVGGSISLNGLNAGKRTSSFSNTYIDNNKFIDVINNAPIVIYPKEGNYSATDIWITNNFFNRTKYNNIKIANFAGTKNVHILNNHMYAIEQYSLGQLAAIQMYIGMRNYDVQNVQIIGNTFIQQYYNQSIGFVFFYNTKNVKIIGNTIIAEGGDIRPGIPNANAPVFAPGETSWPAINYEIADNYASGFDGFIDMDSSVNAKIHDNTMDNMDVPFLIGYGTQQNINMHDNIIINNGGPEYPSLFEFASSSPNNVNIHDNIFFWNRTNLNLTHSIIVTGNNDYRNVTFHDNKMSYNGMNTINQTPKKWSGSEILPIMYNNELVDNIKSTDQKLPIDLNQNPSVDDELLMYLPFTNGDLSDYSGNSNLPATTKVAYKRDSKIGGAYNFDGNTSKIDYGNRVLSVVRNQLTVCAWIKTVDVNKNAQMIVTQSQGTGAGFELRWQDTANKLIFSYRNSTGSTFNSDFYTNGLSSNNWYHVCGVKNETGCYLFVNGTKVIGRDQATSGIESLGNNLNIGSRSDITSTVGMFNGTIDEVRIYNRSLSAGEINSLYLQYAPTYPGYSFVLKNSTTVVKNLTISVINNTATAYHLCVDSTGKVYACV